MIIANGPTELWRFHPQIVFLQVYSSRESRGTILWTPVMITSVGTSLLSLAMVPFHSIVQIENRKVMCLILFCS